MTAQSTAKPILVIGAGSGIGKLTVEQALSHDLPVRAFSRHASDDLSPNDGLHRIDGDALEPEDVARALIGASAVIVTLGIKESVSMLWEEVTLFSRATEVLLEEMPKAGVKRLIAVTGFGAGRSREAMSRLERYGHRAVLGKPYADKDRQEALIEASDLDWTIVRPVILTNGRARDPKVLRSPETWRNGLVPRASVACYLIEAAKNDLDIRTDVVLAR